MDGQSKRTVQTLDDMIRAPCHKFQEKSDMDLVREEKTFKNSVNPLVKTLWQNSLGT